MSGVDDRVVHMNFDNAEFEKRMATTLGSIDQLQKSLDFSNSRKNLDDLAATGNRFSMGNMAASVEGVSGKFLALATVGITTLANLTTKAVESGLAFVKSFTFAPVMDGFHEFETNMGSIQTILANTKSKGSTLDDVNGALAQLNTYSDKTIYNFSEMARNIGTFTAAGVDLDKSTASIKGIANLAALSGSNSEQASTAMYQLSQAIASGSVKLMDWNSVVNAGMGGETLQKALFESGKAMKTLTNVPAGQTFEEWKKAGNSFRDSLQSGWLTSEVLTKTLNAASGDLTVAQIKAQGYTDEQAKSLFELGKTGLQAATQVKTLTQLVGTVKEAVGSGWTQTFQILFGNFGESVKLFTDISNAVGGFVKTSADARNKLLQGWKDLGGRTLLINAFKDAIGAVVEIIKPIKGAFKEFFPPKTSADLMQMTRSFADLAGWLHPMPETVHKIKQTFEGVFAIFHIGFAVLKEVTWAIFNLIGNFRGAGDGALGLTASLGHVLLKVDDFLIRAGHLHAFFLKIDHAVDAAAGVLKDFTGSLKMFLYTLRTGFTEDEGTPIESVALAVRHFFEAFKDSGDVADKALGRIHSRFDGLRVIFERLSSVGDKLRTDLSSTFGIIGQWFSELGHNIAASLKPGDFDAAVDAVNVGLLGGIVIMLKKFLSGGLNLDVGHGLFGQIKDSLDQLTGSLKAMETQLKAKALMEIAIAIGVLTISVVALSMVDSGALAKAMTALAVGFGQLIGAMAILNNIASNSRDAAKLGVLAGAMTLMAGAAVTLAVAIRILASMTWEELSKGMAGIAGALALMVGAIKALEGDTAGVIASSVAMVAIATAMTIMAGAVALFGHMSWAEMAKGLVGIGAALGIIAGIMMIMPVASVLAAGLAMIPLATGLTILAGAVALFGHMSWGEMLKGMVGLAASLAIIALAMNAMPVTLPIIAVGLILVGIALAELAGAVKLMGSMDFGTMAKGIGGLAVMLLILDAAMQGMQSALAGALALIVISASLVILTGVLIKLSELSWGDLLKALVGLAAVFVVLGVAGLLLEPVVPALLGLGVAMALLGLGFVLFGAGAYMVAKAIQAFADAGTAGVAALIKSFGMMIGAMPGFIAIFVDSLLKSTGDILNAAGIMLKILTVLLLQILDTVIKLSPKIAEALVAIITAGLVLIRGKFPDVMKTAYDLLITMLKTIRDHMSEVLQVAIDIVVNFATTLKNNAEKLVDAALNLLFAFLDAIGQRAADIEGAAQNLILNFLTGLINNLYRIIDYAVSVIISFAETVANETWRIIKAGGDILINFVEGVAREVWRVIDKGVDIIIQFLNAISNEGPRLARGASEALVNFLNGLADAIRDEAPRIREAGENVASAIVDGMTGGLASKAGNVAKGALDMAKGAVNGVLGFLKSGSPSKLFMEIGGNMAIGMAIGLDRDKTAANSAVQHAERIVRAFSETLSKAPTALEGLDTDPVITPVLDLSKVKTAAAGLNGIIGTPVIAPDVSFAQARTIATTAELAKPNPEPFDSGPKEVKFEQNIYSPEALSTNDIYKGTKSQIALAKEELNI